MPGQDQNLKKLLHKARRPWPQPFWLQSLLHMVHMANLFSECSEETSDVSESSRRPTCFLKLWHRWQPGSYFLVLIVSIATTAALFPVLYPGRGYDVRNLHSFSRERVCNETFLIIFFGLMLASFGAGLVAAFLHKKSKNISSCQISLWFMQSSTGSNPYWAP